MSNDLKVFMSDPDGVITWATLEEDKIFYRFAVEHGVLLIYPKHMSALEM